MSAKSRLELLGAVYVLTLDDDERRNAIGHALASELLDHANRIMADPQARALIVTGAGSAFCAGADLPEIFGDELPTAAMATALRAYYRCFLSIKSLKIPTLAAVNGAAVGAGLNLALACDIRIASPRARFGATFTRIGLHPGGGCTPFLVETIGRQRATRMLLTGATLDAAEALEQGLVSAIADDPVAEAISIAEEIGRIEPWLTEAILTAVDIAVTSPFDSALQFETWAQAESTHNPRFRAWVEKFARPAAEQETENRD